jgi:hypothetical protein
MLNHVISISESSGATPTTSAMGTEQSMVGSNLKGFRARDLKYEESSAGSSPMPFTLAQ